MGNDVGMGTIVVGVDGSAPSKAALNWAVQEAKLRGSDLHIVVSWDFPVVATAEPMIMPTPDTDALVDNAKTIAAAMIATEHLEGSGVPYTVETPEGRPGEELVTAAKDAELLVVGSYGSGPLKELLLGSVSSYCAHHAACPVVLVRTPEK